MVLGGIILLVMIIYLVNKYLGIVERIEALEKKVDAMSEVKKTKRKKE